MPNKRFTDEELLATLPSSADADTTDNLWLRYYRPETDEHLTIDRILDGIKAAVKEIPPYVVSHPMAATYDLLGGWGLSLGDAIAPLDNYSKKIGIRLGAPQELLEHLDENPGDWFHLLGTGAKLQDMIENPEDYAE